MELQTRYPEIPSCADCQAWLHDDRWRRSHRRGLGDIARPPGTRAPCHKCPKACGTNRPCPENELSARNQLALRHYHLCQQDPGGRLVRRDRVTVQKNATIAQVLARIERGRGAELAQVLAALATVIGIKG